MRFLPAVLFLLLCCCAKVKHEKAPHTSEISEALAAKKKLYCEASSASVRSRGFAVSRCDGLIYTSLRSISCGDIDISQFQTDDGRWYRDPAKDCYYVASVTGEKVNNGADSSISKDMLLGAMTYLWRFDDKARVDKTIAYGNKHNWVMGEGIDAVAVISKCVLSPNLIATLFDIQGKLSDGSTFVSANDDEQLGIVNTGFRAHLDVLHILLSGSIAGGITPNQLDTLKAQAERQPRNALYQAAYATYTDGDMTNATNLLLDTSFFPADRLPTSAEYCSDYLWSDDDTPKDYAPCPDKSLTFDGTDFAIAASLIDGSYFKRRK